MRKSVDTPLSNRLFVPSSRAVVEHGMVLIGPNAMKRGDRAAQHYHENPARFRERGAFILCSGGYSVSAARQEAPQSREDREAHLLARYLRYIGVPSALIETEDESTSALSNVANSVTDGWLFSGNFNDVDRLGVVSPPLYQKRLAIILAKVDIPAEAIEPLYTDETMSTATELAGRVITRALLIGASGPADLLQAEVRFNRFFAGHSGNQA